MRDLEQSVRAHREKAAQELVRLEAQVEALKSLIKVLDDLVERPSEVRMAEPRAKKGKTPTGEINDLIMAACISSDWKTADELVSEVPGLRSRSKSNISTRCRLLWLNGHLDRRDRCAFRGPEGPNRVLVRKEYEYKVRVEEN